MLLAIARFVAHKYVPSHRKRYKMFYIGGFIMKSIVFLRRSICVKKELPTFFTGRKMRPVI